MQGQHSPTTVTFYSHMDLWICAFEIFCGGFVIHEGKDVNGPAAWFVCPFVIDEVMSAYKAIESDVWQLLEKVRSPAECVVPVI